MSPTRSVELPAPFPHQREILLSPARIKVPCLGRQAGKTMMGGRMALEGHGPIGADGLPVFKGALHGATIWWVTKDFPTADRILRDLRGYLSKWGGDLQWNEQKRRIVFPGGGSITIRSGGDPTTMHGETLDGVVGDEVAFWHKDSLAELEPALAVKQGWIVLISTPYGFNFFHDEWRRGRKDDPNFDPIYESWQLPSSVNPAFSAEEFERQRHKHNAIVFAREYLAEFAVAAGELFRREWFRFYRQDEKRIYPDLGEPVDKLQLKNIIAADCALTKHDYSDFTVALVLGVAPDGRAFVRDVVRGKHRASEIVPMLRRLQDRYEARFVHVEKSGPLVHLNRSAAAAGVRILEYSIHRKVNGDKGQDKVARAQPCSEAVELGKLMFPKMQQPNGAYAPASWVVDLITECCSFTGEKGGRDDQVDALALGWLGVPFILPRTVRRVIGTSGGEHSIRTDYGV